jgi:hypothetical protein
MMGGADEERAVEIENEELARVRGVVEGRRRILGFG